MRRVRENTMWRKIFYRKLPLRGENIKVRSCKRNDADLITELHNAPYTRKYLGGPLGTTIESTQSKISETHEDKLYIIETSDGQRVGFTGFIENPDTEGMDILIIISSKFTKKQIGREVLDVMVKNGRCLFTKYSIPVTVTTRIDNIPAIKLLEGSSFGFVRRGEYTDQKGNRNLIYYIA